MTGPEHYRAAERLANGHIVSSSGRQIGPTADEIALAQVHATLALAAATGLNDAEQGFMVEDLHDWRDVAGVMPEGAS